MRNRLFALSALFDVLELRGAGSPVLGRYLPHLRLELSRLESFAEGWQQDAPEDATTPNLRDALAAAIARTSELGALRDVRLSFAHEPETDRALRHPALVTATFTLLLDEVVRAAEPGAHVWLAVARSPQDELAVEVCARDATPLAGAGVELARAALRAFGGDLAPGGADNPAAVAVARLGPSA